MKIRIIQWCDTKEYTIEKKTWGLSGWQRLEDDLFHYTETWKWEMRKNSFTSLLDALAFVVKFKVEGRDAFIKNEISPTVLQFDLNDAEKIFGQKRKEALDG